MQQRTEMPSGPAPASVIAQFSAALRWEDIPAPVIERAKLLILDGLGVGLASNAYPFAERSLAGIRALAAPGSCSVIGNADKLAPRDAALANGILVHGLDFDDTHMASIVHPTAACLPTALAMAESLGLGGRDLLVAYVAGMEAAIRIGLAVDGRFHHAGFHATGVVAHFSAALVAGKLLGLTPEQLVSAQGIAASTAAGIQVFLEDGAWTKRLHPAWAASAGITAATLAQHGFAGPKRPYEGKFGLFDTHLQAHANEVDLGRLTIGLGSTWMLAETAIKPYPVCHFIHGAADAAVELSKQCSAADIAAVEIALPAPTMPIVAEPTAIKERPQTDYDAKFSAQFVVAGCLARGQFGLAELTADALRDPQLLALAARSRCVVDPDTAFPTYFSGGVSVTLADGRKLTRHVRVNSGAGEKSLDVDGVSAKYRASAAMAIGSEQAERIRKTVLGMDGYSAAQLGAELGATRSAA